jgi:glyceraldehyde 3-phosphate dehydrogenase
MSVKIGINGFGRIGRLMFRHAINNPDKFRVMAINDLNEIDYIIYLLKYDSSHGKFPRYPDLIQ